MPATTATGGPSRAFPWLQVSLVLVLVLVLVRSLCLACLGGIFIFFSFFTHSTTIYPPSMPNINIKTNINININIVNHQHLKSSTPALPIGGFSQADLASLQTSGLLDQVPMAVAAPPGGAYDDIGGFIDDISLNQQVPAEGKGGVGSGGRGGGAGGGGGGMQRTVRGGSSAHRRRASDQALDAFLGPADINDPSRLAFSRTESMSSDAAGSLRVPFSMNSLTGIGGDGGGGGEGGATPRGQRPRLGKKLSLGVAGPSISMGADMLAVEAVPVSGDDLRKIEGA